MTGCSPGSGRTCEHSGSVTGHSSQKSAQLGLSTGVSAGTAEAQAVGGSLRGDGVDLGESLQHLLRVTPLCEPETHVSLEPQDTGLGPTGGKKTSRSYGCSFGGA